MKKIILALLVIPLVFQNCTKADKNEILKITVDPNTQENIEKEKIYQKLLAKGWLPDENSNPIIALYKIDY